MKQATGIAIGVVAVTVLAAGTGYWLGSRAAVSPADGSAVATAAAAKGAGEPEKRKILYLSLIHI